MHTRQKKVGEVRNGRIHIFQLELSGHNRRERKKGMVEPWFQKKSSLLLSQALLIYVSVLEKAFILFIIFRCGKDETARFFISPLFLSRKRKWMEKMCTEVNLGWWYSRRHNNMAQILSGNGSSCFNSCFQFNSSFIVLFKVDIFFLSFLHTGSYKSSVVFVLWKSGNGKRT